MEAGNDHFFVLKRSYFSVQQFYLEDEFTILFTERESVYRAHPELSIIIFISLAQQESNLHLPITGQDFMRVRVSEEIIRFFSDSLFCHIFL
jgi:hypothetical protein